MDCRGEYKEISFLVTCYCLTPNGRGYNKQGGLLIVGGQLSIGSMGASVFAKTAQFGGLLIVGGQLSIGSMGASVFAKTAQFGGLLIVGGQLSIGSMGTQTFQNSSNWLLILYNYKINSLFRFP